jgi:hypothetical protein
LTWLNVANSATTINLPIYLNWASKFARFDLFVPNLLFLLLLLLMLLILRISYICLLSYSNPNRTVSMSGLCAVHCCFLRVRLFRRVSKSNSTLNATLRLI